ncbi:hypothetical protein ACGFZA_28335 [Streptomyces sp. NPDC048211]
MARLRVDALTDREEHPALDGTFTLNLQAPHVDVAPAAWSAFVAYACRG